MIDLWAHIFHSFRRVYKASLWPSIVISGKEEAPVFLARGRLARSLQDFHGFLFTLSWSRDPEARWAFITHRKLERNTDNRSIRDTAALKLWKSPNTSLKVREGFNMNELLCMYVCMYVCIINNYVYMGQNLWRASSNVSNINNSLNRMRYLLSWTIQHLIV